MSVVDRGEPLASCSEWQGDGTAAEHDAASLGGRWFREHPLHEGGLALGVGDVIVAEPGSQGPLQIAVGVGRSGVGPEGIAEGEMTVERRSADDADVQVVGWCACRGGEGFAAGNAEVAFVVVAKGT